MKTIVLVDPGEYTPSTLKRRPLAGAETAVIELVSALARLGHRVIVRNNCSVEQEEVLENLEWRRFRSDEKLSGDLLIVNRSMVLYDRVSFDGMKCLYLHNEAKYLLSPKNLLRMVKNWPNLVFSGEYHKSTYPALLPAGKRIVIPYGITDMFYLDSPRMVVPKPHAIFTSNPTRELDWVVDRWVNEIHPAVPEAELHVYSGPSTYGKYGEAIRHRMEKAISYVRDNEQYGIYLKEPVKKSELADTLRGYRLMPYRGVAAETFCLAVAEAAASGVPAVVQDIGSMKERVVDGQTGYVTSTEAAFSEAAIQLLSDDQLWLRVSKNAFENAKRYSWDASAKQFVDLLQRG